MSERAATQKSADAYRTISEVAEDLKLPQHVLRFWETRFPQVKPLKRAGGRRFYRPEDVHLLRAVKTLLYGDGYTIRGVQRLLREQGPRAVATLAASAAVDRRRARDEPMLDTGENVGGAITSAGLPAMVEPPMECRAKVADAVAERPNETPSAFDGGVRPGETAPRDLAARLRTILLDLADCERILAAARAVDG